jgi:hypothetical protein
MLANYKENGEKSSLPLQQAYFDNCIIDSRYSADSTKLYSGQIAFFTHPEDVTGNDETFNYRITSCFVKTARVDSDRFVQCLFVTSPSYWEDGMIEKELTHVYDFRLANESVGIGAANRTISEKYPVDRYGVDRLTNSHGPTIGAYEYVYRATEEDD